jgi:ABC-type multidrug transport system ATPase subunit
MNEGPMIRCEAATMAYGRRRALDAVTLEVGRGSVYALLGRNGAGKSTLVKGLLGLARPVQGGFQVLGMDAFREREAIMARLGGVPEAPQVPPSMSADRASAY